MIPAGPNCPIFQHLKTVRSNRITKPFLGRHKRRPAATAIGLTRLVETIRNNIEAFGRLISYARGICRLHFPVLSGHWTTSSSRFDVLKTNSELRNTVASALKTGAPVIEAVKVAQKPSRNPPDNTRIADVDLPTRIQNVLAWNGIATLGQLREMPDKTLLSFQDLGHRSLAFLREYLG
jgi:Bacterial RNA polymerase, alpha chain C terminal domain